MKQDLMERTKQFALRVIRLYGAFPQGEVARILGKQILRSATSVGAHYREAQRAKSTPDFVSKIEGALQELEETRYRIELLEGAELLTPAQLGALKQESTELIAILITIAKNTKSPR
jgi:four helix bundle protein